MFGIVHEEIEAYAFEHTTPLPPALEELRRDMVVNADAPSMLSDQMVGILLQCLIHASGAKRVLELGTFTGFSALMMAHALPEDGKLITCDINPRPQAPGPRPQARHYFGKTPHGRKIEIRVGPALETLKTLDGPFDPVFINADKTNYTNYYERCLELLSPSGLIVVDNTLWSGKVMDPKDEDARAIAAFNDHVKDDARVEQVLLIVRDGLMLIRKR